MRKPALDQIVQNLMNSEGRVGILWHGSAAAKRSDSASDIDLICISGAHRLHHTSIFDDVIIDIYESSREELEDSIKADKPTNNNFALNAFAHGRILVSRDGSCEALAQLAKQKWQAGPSEPSPNEQTAIRVSLQKAVISAKRLVVRVDKLPERRELIHIDMGRLFFHAVYTYCRIHRLWSSSISDMLNWTDPRYSTLLSMCWQYLRAADFKNRADTIGTLANITMNRIATFGSGDQTKLTVSFPGYGQKKLVEKYAGLEKA